MGYYDGKALFAVLDQFEDPFDLSVNHFIFQAAFEKSKHLILLPLKHFDALAKKCGDPRPGRVSIMQGTSRFAH